MPTVKIILMCLAAFCWLTVRPCTAALPLDGRVDSVPLPEPGVYEPREAVAVRSTDDDQFVDALNALKDVFDAHVRISAAHQWQTVSWMQLSSALQSIGSNVTVELIGNGLTVHCDGLNDNSLYLSSTHVVLLEGLTITSCGSSIEQSLFDVRGTGSLTFRDVAFVGFTGSLRIVNADDFASVQLTNVSVSSFALVEIPGTIVKMSGSAICVVDKTVVMDMFNIDFGYSQAFRVFTDAYLFVSRSTFQNVVGGIVECAGDKAMAVLLSCSFSETSAKDASIAMAGLTSQRAGVVFIDYCTGHPHANVVDFGGIVAVGGSGKAFIMNSAFVGVSGYEGGFAYGLESSTIVLINVTVVDLYASVVGGTFSGVGYSGDETMNVVAISSRFESMSVDIARYWDTTYGGFGGFFAGDDTNALFDNCVIRNCHSVFRGGVFSLRKSSKVLVVDTTVSEGATDGDGGLAALTDSSLLTLVNSNVTGMSARNGGAISASLEARVTIILSTFDELASEGNGAIMLSDTAQVTIVSSAFSKVSALSGGVFSLTDQSAVMMVNSTISLAHALVEGAVALLQSTAMLFITNSSISGVHASISGGAIRVRNEASATLDHVNVSSTYAAVGGVIHADGNSVINMAYCTFYNTSALRRGASIFLEGSASASVVSSAFVHSQAQRGVGGVVYAIDNARLTFDQCAFIQSSAGTDGGSIYIDDYTLCNVTSSAFIGSHAGGLGGAISASGRSQLILSSCNISSSSAISGGILSVSIESVVVLRSIIGDITSATSGGIAYLSDSATASIADSQFSNLAAKTGGAFATFSSSSCRIVRSTFSSCTAFEQGGFAFVSDSSIFEAATCTLQNVSARRSEKSTGTCSLSSGAAFAVTGGRVVLTELVAIDVSSEGAGGFLSATGNASVLLANSTLARAAAGTNGGLVTVSGGASVVFDTVGAENATAGSHGGCFYVDTDGHLSLDSTIVQGCRAGLAAATFGAGGCAFIAPSGHLQTSASVAVRPKAIRGPGVFSADGSFNAVSLLPSIVGAVGVAPDDSIDWSAGGLLSSEAVTIQISPPAARIDSSGGSVASVMLTVFDAYNSTVSLPGNTPLNFRLVGDWREEAGCENEACTVSGSVSLPTPLGTSPTLRLGTFEVFAPPGSYLLRIVSTNPFVFGDLDENSARRQLLQRTVLNLTVGKCPTGTIGGIGTDSPKIYRCLPLEAAVGMSGGGDQTTVAVAASVVSAVALIAVLVAGGLWRRSVVRLRESEATHHEFVEKHLSQDQSLGRIELSRACIELFETLGEGEFGIVCRSRVVLEDGRPRVCAAKMMKPGASYQERCDFVSEATVMNGLHHPNVVSLCGVVLQSEPMLILLEYVPYGSLLSFVRQILPSQKMSRATSRMLWMFCRQIALGMAYLATVGIVHRDLAARNCMVGQDTFGEYVIKVADFGLSGVLAGKNYFRKGSGKERLPVRWLSPEAMEQRRFTEASDVWAFGVTAWEVFSFGEIPFGTMTSAALVGFVLKGGRLSRPAACQSRDIFDTVISPCWREQPEDRPTFDALVKALTAIVSEEKGGIDKQEMAVMPDLMPDMLNESLYSNVYLDQSMRQLIPTGRKSSYANVVVPTPTPFSPFPNKPSYANLNLANQAVDLPNSAIRDDVDEMNHHPLATVVEMAYTNETAV